MRIFHYKRRPGAVSNILQVAIEDSGTPGTGKSGLAFNTGSLIAYYKRDTAASAVAITLVTATLGTFTSGGFKEIDATHMTGLYEIHVPDAAFVAGAKSVSIVIQGASGMFQSTIIVDLGQALAAESYAVDGAEPDESQILYMILSLLGQFSISGVTLTTKKLDGTTTAMTYTLDDATNPTSRVR